jgi:hypothetical protein
MTSNIPQDTNIIPFDQEDIELLDNYYSVYTKDQKLQVIDLFCKGSSLAEIYHVTGIPKTTLQNWKDRSPWWDEIVNKYKKDKQIELDNLLTNSIHKAILELNDRLQDGDYKPDRQGELKRVPISARDLAVTLSSLYEKRALIRGEATSIKSESKNSLQSLEDKFKSFALQLKEKDVVSVVQESDEEQ